MVLDAEVLDAEGAGRIRVPSGGRADDLYISIGISCSSNIEAEGEKLRADYSVTISENTYRPYGIRCVLLNEGEISIGEETAECRFATLDEALSIMIMLAQEAVLPGTLNDVLE